MVKLISRNSVLKKLKAIYWRSFYNNKCQVALKVLELQTNYSNLLEKKSLPKDRAEGQCRNFMNDLKALDSKLKHPPPHPSIRPLKS